MGRCLTQSGSATIELTGVIPILVAVTLVLIGVIGVGRDQVLAQGAAREGAREAALGGDPARAVEAARAALPTGRPATVTVLQAGGNTVRVEVGLTASLPLRPAPITVRAAAVALLEPGLAPAPAGP